MSFDINRLADQLHAELCQWSHIDQCAYHYQGKQAEIEKERWREKARKLVEGVFT